MAIIEVGPGRQTNVSGAGGDDVYRVSNNGGLKSILDSGGFDVIELAAGIRPRDIRIWAAEASFDTSVFIAIVDGRGRETTTLELRNFNQTPARAIEVLRFADGREIDLFGPSLTFQPAGGVTRFGSTNAGGRLIATANSEALRGRSGDDEFVFGGRFNQQRVFDEGGDDALLLPTAQPANVRVWRARFSDDLFVGVVNRNGVLESQVTIANHFRPANQIERLTVGSGARSVEIDLTDGLTLQQAPNVRTPIRGTVFDDRIIFNAEDSIAEGGAGNDTYVFDGVRGNFIIRDSGGRDAIELGRLFDNERISIVRATDFFGNPTDDMLILATNARGLVQSTITVQGQFAQRGGAVEQVVLRDGTTVATDAFFDVIRPGRGGGVIRDLPGDSVIEGSRGNDRIELRFGNNSVDARAGNDTVIGGPGNDTILGGAGNDQLRGEAGDDKLFGGQGNDTLNGGDGNDTLDGGPGRDGLIGGAGPDVFVFADASHSRPGRARRDTVTDFGRGDRIDLSQIDADATRAGEQAFAFIGAARFSGAPGELRFDAGRLLGDLDGDRQPDFEVFLNGIERLTEASFTDGSIL